jgi:DNA primase
MIDVSVVVVLEHYGAFVSVPDTGWRALRCPFHDDRTASASVNIELNGFRCHACGISGDAIKLIMDRENVGFEAACEFARQVLGQSVEGVSPSIADKKRKPRRSKWDKGLFD